MQQQSATEQPFILVWRYACGDRLVIEEREHSEDVIKPESRERLRMKYTKDSDLLFNYKTKFLLLHQIWFNLLIYKSLNKFKDHGQWHNNHRTKTHAINSFILVQESALTHFLGEGDGFWGCPFIDCSSLNSSLIQFLNTHFCFLIWMIIKLEF